MAVLGATRLSMGPQTSHGGNSIGMTFLASRQAWTDLGCALAISTRSFIPMRRKAFVQHAKIEFYSSETLSVRMPWWTQIWVAVNLLGPVDKGRASSSENALTGFLQTGNGAINTLMLSSKLSPQCPPTTAQLSSPLSPKDGALYFLNMKLFGGTMNSVAK